jgi:type III secretion system YscQ/HrcQ family protein
MMHREVNPPTELNAPNASRARLFAALPRLSGTALALRNRAYRAPPTLLKDERVLIWQASGPVDTIGELACRVGSWQLALAADNLARVEPRLEGFESFVPTETCAALVEHALTPVLALIERLLGVPVECGEFHRGAPQSVPPDEVTIGFVIYESNLQAVMRGWIRTTPDAWHQMDFCRAQALPSRRIKAVPVRLSVSVGHCQMSLRELRELAVGDALRSTPRIALSPNSLQVRLTDGVLGNHRADAHSFSIFARVSGDTMILEHQMTTHADSQSTQLPVEPRMDTPDGHASNDLIDDIQCEVTFELGSLRMTVAEISQLRMGQSMRMGVRLQEQPVRVLVNGRMLARGELAAVGDELVVVITDTSRMPHV